MINLAAGTRIVTATGSTYTLDEPCIDPHNRTALAMVTGPAGREQILAVSVDDQGAVDGMCTRTGRWQPAKVAA